jgi:hypothetical protein
MRIGAKRRKERALDAEIGQARRGCLPGGGFQALGKTPDLETIEDETYDEYSCKYQCYSMGLGST